MPDITNILILKSLILLCKENRSILNAYVTKNLDSGMADNNKRLQKGLEKRQKNLNANLEALKEKLGEKKDDCVDFHAMGGMSGARSVRDCKSQAPQQGAVSALRSMAGGKSKALTERTDPPCH